MEFSTKGRIRMDSSLCFIRFPATASLYPQALLGREDRTIAAPVKTWNDKEDV